MSAVDDYFKGFKPSQKAQYERVKKIVLDMVPDAEETISYGIPTLTYKGKYLIYFGAFKDHMSLFPGSYASAEVKDKLKGFKLGKGTIQFTEEKPVPKEVIRDLVAIRYEKLKK